MGAALFLTVFKVVVGVFSGSIGILAEAAHSGLDLAAAVITYVAVRASGKPADREHPYGHGKIENLSAMAETMLLLLTCVWVVYEAAQRLTRKHIEVDASFWAFAVMIISIIVDVSRSRMLLRMARKHRSQALEADALHFSTDIWSSAVVILGLVCVRVAGAYPSLAFLQKADALAALVVAAIVIYISAKLGFGTVQGLLDTADAGAAEKIQQAVEAVSGVQDCHAIRLRRSGPRYFVDLHVTFDGNEPLQVVHNVMDRIEETVQQILPDADVTVHPEPAPSQTKQPPPP